MGERIYTPFSTDGASPDMQVPYALMRPIPSNMQAFEFSNDNNPYDNPSPLKFGRHCLHDFQKIMSNVDSSDHRTIFPL